MFVLIGAPVYDREWILPDWFKAIEQQDFPLSDIGFVFEGAPNDEATIAELIKFQERHPELRCFDLSINTVVEHETHPEGRRIWTPDRYETMVKLRNSLLDRAIAHNPDRYFSLDTDILLENPRTISELVQLSAAVDAVGPLMFMTPKGVMFPSIMYWVENEPIGWRGRRLYPQQYRYGEVFQADVIMAAVMMSKNVYQTSRYCWHRQGEDLGWSADCAMKGFKLYSASNLYCPHIMSRKALAEYKECGDSRGLEASQGNFSSIV